MKFIVWLLILFLLPIAGLLLLAGGATLLGAICIALPALWLIGEVGKLAT